MSNELKASNVAWRKVRRTLTMMVLFVGVGGLAFHFLWGGSVLLSADGLVTRNSVAVASPWQDSRVREIHSLLIRRPYSALWRSWRRRKRGLARAWHNSTRARPTSIRCCRWRRQIARRPSHSWKHCKRPRPMVWCGARRCRS